MKGHNHRCHTHTHGSLMIMPLFWEYYNSANNTADDDNFTVSFIFFKSELDGHLELVFFDDSDSKNRKHNCELLG